MNLFEEALLRYLSPAQLARIRQVKVGIAGAGGLGSNCAAILVRCGFRRLKIADFDRVDYSNLNRQHYFADQVGREKLEALKENLVRINQDIELELLPLKLEPTNAGTVFADCDVVIEALDQVEYKRLVIDAYANSPQFLVAASGLAGWGDSDRIRVHRINARFTVIGDLTTAIGENRPPLAPGVAITAAKQADVVLQYVLGPMGGETEHAISTRHD